MGLFLCSKGVIIIYSYELNTYISTRNHSLNSQEYLFVSDINQHSQINHIKYNPLCDNTTIWTDDNYEWTVTVNNQNNGGITYV